MGIHDGGEPTGAYIVGFGVSTGVEIHGANPCFQDGATNAKIGAAVAVVLDMSAEDEPLGHIHRFGDFAEGLIVDDFDFQLRQEAFSHAAVACEDVECHNGAENAVSDEFQFFIVEFLEGDTIVWLRGDIINDLIGVLVLRAEYTIGFVDTGTLEEGCVCGRGSISVAGKNGMDGGVVDDFVCGIPRVVELFAVLLDDDVFHVFILHSALSNYIHYMG